MKTTNDPQFLPPGVAGRLDRMDAVDRRSARMERAARLGGFFVLLAVMAMSVDAGLRLFHPLARWLLSLAVLGGLVSMSLILWHRRAARQPGLTGSSRMAAARAAEESLPDLQERWSTLASLESEENPLLRGAPALIGRVREEAAGFSQVVARPGRAVRKRFGRMMLWAAGGAGLLAVFHAADPERAAVLWHRLLAPWSSASLTRIEVVPGSVGQVVARHELCQLQATVCGRPAREATLFLAQNGSVTEVQLTADLLADVPFQHALRDPVEDFAFRFRSGDGQTDWHRVRVADRPVIQAASVTVTPPAYTRQAPEKYPGIPPSLRVLEGSQLTVKVAPGRSGDGVWLMMDGGNGGKKWPATAPVDAGQYFSMELAVTESVRFFPLVVSPEGLENRLPPVCALVMLEDRPPVVTLKEDSAAEAITPADTIEVAFSASDDVGIEGAEVLITMEKDGAPPREITVPVDLGESQGSRNIDRRIPLDLSKLPLEPNAKISYAVRVSDGKAAAGNSARKGHGKEDPKAADEAFAKNEKKDAAGADGKPSPDNHDQTGGQDSKDSKAGANPPPPPDTMGKRELDLAGQCSCSNSRKLEIDGYTGESPAFREKKSLPVLPVLQKIKGAAETGLRLTVDARRKMAGGRAEAALLPDFQQADGKTDMAVQQSTAFTAMTKGTPYEMIGLDLENLRLREFLPAGEALKAVPSAANAAPEADKAAMHLRSAVAWLERLMAKAEKASQAEAAAQLAQKLKEMHRIFLEDSLKLLNLAKGQPGEVPELPLIEVNREYARMLEQLEKAKAELMKEFAALLAKDPDLLARFTINRSKGADALQVQLASLSMEQDTLNRQTNQLAAGSSTTPVNFAAQAEARQNLLVEELGSQMRAAVAFFPKNIPRDTPEAKAFFDAMLQAASLPSADNQGRLKAITAALTSLDALGQLNGGASWAARQRAKLTDLRIQQEWTGEFSRAVASNAKPRGVELLQRDLERRTRILNAKMERSFRMFAQMPPNVQQAAAVIKTTLSTNAVPAQLTAADSLRKTAWKPAAASQEKASQALASAVRGCTELVRMVAEEMRKNPPAPPIAGEAPDPPSLASLLAMFEKEAQEDEDFSLPQWKLNVQLAGDWLSQCKSGGGAGAGASPSAKPGEKPGEKPGRDPADQAAGAAMKEKLKAAAEHARALAAAAAKAQQEANEKAKALATAGAREGPDLAATPAAPHHPRREAWNKLPSELTRNLRQQQDSPPPEEYRHAVETYFRRIGLGQIPPAAKP